MGKTPRLIRDPQFSKRLNQAADQHTTCPPLHAGRLVWVQNALHQKGQSVSIETVRKWFAGEAKPRPPKSLPLADILDVDHAWLVLGEDQHLPMRERKRRSAAADGLTNLIAGLIELDGGAASVPETEGDCEIDLLAIIKGAHYRLILAIATEESGGYRFAFPAARKNCIGILVVKSGFKIQIFEVPDDLINSKGQTRGASVEVFCRKSDILEIENFKNRI